MIIVSENGIVSVDTSCISRVLTRRVAPKYWYIDILYKNVNVVDSIEVVSEEFASDIVRMIDSRIEG